ncbi:MAG: hypothetical protein CDV28_1712 [Candidatus Electronema aureum]|uniref:Uncharacterized protein n=1 Tax=Candidatus Electronema aureum TaxID=2005002 RepID=A0A521FY36_9BACT|nr:MAG: hypothetical protein CDV28_1712 [Candidatus Electronema aureum]
MKNRTARIARATLLFRRTTVKQFFRQWKHLCLKAHVFCESLKLAAGARSSAWIAASSTNISLLTWAVPVRMLADAVVWDSFALPKLRY